MYAPPEVVVVAYLTGQFGLAGVAVETPEPLQVELPFALVTRVSGSDDMITDSAAVDVDVFNVDRSTALATATQVHLAMIALRGAAVNGTVIDHVETLMAPAWISYDDEHVQRYVARYLIELRLGIPLSVANPPIA